MTPPKDPWRAEVERRLDELELHVTSQDERDPGLLTRVRDIEQRFKRWDKVWIWISGGSFLGLVASWLLLKKLGIL